MKTKRKLDESQIDVGWKGRTIGHKMQNTRPQRCRMAKQQDVGRQLNESCKELERMLDESQMDCRQKLDRRRTEVR
jgi:hypothetical protein